MSCTLNKMNVYNVGRIVHDNNTGSYTAQLVQPPVSCPDTSFTSKKAELRVVEGMRPQLTFDIAKARPVIIVPTSAYVEEVGASSSGVGFGLMIALFGAVALGALYLLFRRSQSTLTTTGTGYVPGSRGSASTYQGNGYRTNIPQPAPVQQGGTTVINNGSNNDGLLTGMMLGSMMSNNRSERVIERDTTVIERDSSSRSDDSYSSDNSSDSNYSSDSSSDSSYSSDDSSSFSSDSSSSDSGGSFSSDS